MDPQPLDVAAARSRGEPKPARKPGVALSLEEIFTPREADLVRRTSAFADGGRAGPFRIDLVRALETGIGGLGNIAEGIASYPSLRETRTLGGKERSVNTLIEGLIRGGEHAFEWNLPTKAVLSRAFGIAKVNFFTSLRYVIEACQGEEVPGLLEEISSSIEEAVYSRLAEELYGSLITTPSVSNDLKRLAANQLVEIWEGRIGFTVEKFSPLLRSAWAARMRAVRVFGTLLGTAEILQLLFGRCEAGFVTWFSRREVTHDEQQAFEEFLFDLPYESLEKVRVRMREEGLSVVDRTKVEEYLALPAGSLRPTVGEPKDLYVSFRRRRVKAQYRAATGAPGPRRTAEAYLMEAMLRHQLPGGPPPSEACGI
jgi:hypothetical protein